MSLSTGGNIVSGWHIEDVSAISKVYWIRFETTSLGEERPWDDISVSDLKVDWYIVEGFEKFLVGEGRIATKNELGFDINVKPRATTTSYKQQLEKQNHRLHIKLPVYRVILRPLVMYKCETWVWTKRNKKKLRIWEEVIETFFFLKNQ